MFFFQKVRAFSLAEILLTITIIGIVASSTIPSLVLKVQNNTTLTKLKKNYSTLVGVVNAIKEDGTSMDTLFPEEDDVVTPMNEFAKHLSVAKNCDTGEGCFPNVSYKSLDGLSFDNINNDSNVSKLLLADGTSLLIQEVEGTCDNHEGTSDPNNPYYYYCGTLGIDVNGFSGPNQVGKDLFYFLIWRNGIRPLGLSMEDAYHNDCKYGGAGWGWQGWGCAGKILSENAINY